MGFILLIFFYKKIVFFSIYFLKMAIFFNKLTILILKVLSLSRTLMSIVLLSLFNLFRGKCYLIFQIDTKVSFLYISNMMKLLKYDNMKPYLNILSLLLWIWF